MSAVWFIVGTLFGLLLGYLAVEVGIRRGRALAEKRGHLFGAFDPMSGEVAALRLLVAADVLRVDQFNGDYEDPWFSAEVHAELVWTDLAAEYYGHQPAEGPA